MKAVKISTILALTLIVGLGMAGMSFAKKPTGPTGMPAPPGPQKSYMLCLESTTDVAGPRARWNLMVAMGKVSGQLILADATPKPTLFMNFNVTGKMDPNGDIKFKGEGMGSDGVPHVVQGMVQLEKKSDKGPYAIEYKPKDAPKWMKAKGGAFTAPCVQHGALR